MNNNQKFKLCLNSGSKKTVLLEDTLMNIDEFTTFFKNKESLIEELLGKKINVSSFDITIESTRTRTIPINFIGSDFRGVSKVFNDDDSQMEYISTLSMVDSTVLLKYLNEDLDKITNNDENKKKEYMENDNIITTRLIKNLEEEISGNSTNYEALATNITYNVRDYCNKYEQFRKVFCYMTSLGILENEEKNYTEEETKSFEEKLNKMKEEVLSFIEELKEKASRDRKLSEEAKFHGLTLVRNEKRQLMFEDATMKGIDLYKKDKKVNDLVNEGNELGYKLYKDEKNQLILEDATQKGIEIYRNEKRDALMKEGQEFGRECYQTDAEDFELEYNATPETDESFNEYLNNYYKKQLKDTEKDSQEITANYNDELVNIGSAEVQKAM